MPCLWKPRLSCLLIAALMVGSAPLWAQDAADPNAAIEATIMRYVDAFNKKDLPALGGLMLENAIHTDHETGERTVGRQAILADVTAALEENPDLQLGGRLDQIRLVRPEVASVQGQTSISDSSDAPPAVTSFTSILVKQGDAWLIESIDEMAAPQPPDAYTALKVLEWMVGKWVDASEAMRVETTVRWGAGRAFLIRSYTITTADETPQQGTQIIGWDPRARQIRSWTFDSSGSFGDGVWSKNGQEWLIRSTQTLPDGKASSGTYVMSMIDSDSFSVQLVGQEVDGEPVPSTGAVKVTRVKETDSASNP